MFKLLTKLYTMYLPWPLLFSLFEYPLMDLETHVPYSCVRLLRVYPNAMGQRKSALDVSIITAAAILMLSCNQPFVNRTVIKFHDRLVFGVWVYRMGRLSFPSYVRQP